VALGWLGRLAGWGAEPAGAQASPARPVSPVIRYQANESGGRIALSYADNDSTLIEAARLELIEMAAAIRRGDIRSVRVIRAELPAARVLSSRSERIRCTFRPTIRGGELVLLSDDDAVVKAIHQILAAGPPTMVRL
jgi:hypothetical protein